MNMTARASLIARVMAFIGRDRPLPPELSFVRVYDPKVPSPKD